MDLRKKKLQEKGITLIALVVTIIILLILAGVTITAVMSDNGLFKKARMAAEIHTIAVEKEQINMCYNSVKIGKLSTDAQGGAGNLNTQPTKQKTSVYFKLFRNSSDEIIGFYSNSDSTSYPNSTLVADFGSRGDDGSYSKTVSNDVYDLNIKKVVINDEIVPGNLSGFFGMLGGKDESTIENLSNLNTSQATDFSAMFAGMAIKNIDLSSWNVEKAQNFNSMFGGCSSLESINVSNWNLESVQNFGGMFGGCSSLEEIDLSKWNVKNAASGMFGSMFAGCTSLTKISLFNTPGGVSSGYGIFNSMLYGAPNVTELKNLSGLDVSSTNTLNNMFAGCSSLTKIDISNWNTSNITTLQYIFAGCSNLKEVVMDNLDLSKVTNFSDLFNSCSKLEKISLKNTRLNSVTSLNSAFSGLSSIKEIDLSNANLGNVSNFSGAFSDLSTLTKVNFSGATVSSAADLRGMFAGDSLITELDLSGFNSSNITAVDNMFRDCTALTTIYVSNSWDISGLTPNNGMFNGTTSLVGGNGTTYSSEHRNSDYAVIDGKNGNPGYLTLKNPTNTSSVNINKIKYLTGNLDLNNIIVTPEEMKEELEKNKNKISYVRYKDDTTNLEIQFAKTHHIYVVDQEGRIISEPSVSETNNNSNPTENTTTNNTTNNDDDSLGTDNIITVGNEEITITSSNAKNYYGYKVTNYHPANDENGVYRIFYYDANGDYGKANTLYLIRDYSSDLKVTLSNVIGNESWTLDANSSTRESALARFKTLNPLWTTSNYNSSKSTYSDLYYVNERASVWLCNENYFTNFKDSSKASYVVGGASIQMFMASYNSVTHGSVGNHTLSVEMEKLGYANKVDGTKYDISQFYPDRIIDYQGQHSMYAGKNGSAADSRAEVLMASPQSDDHLNAASICSVENKYGDLLWTSASTESYLEPLVALKTGVSITAVDEN